MATIPLLDVLCTHRGAAGREHGAVLTRMRAALAADGLCRQADGTGPLVVVHCGDEHGRRAARRRAARHAESGVEIVHVRLDGPAARTLAQGLVRGALRFAALAGHVQAPRRGLLATFLRQPPLALAEDRCPGSERCDLCAQACGPKAIRFGAGDRPVVRAGACNLCGRCVERCPRGAWGWAWAPWPALLARLETLLAIPVEAEGGLALLLSEQQQPLKIDEPRETEQLGPEWIVPFELPRGTLGAGLVLRALELGAARVCAVVPRHSSVRLAELEAAAAVARATGATDAVRIARSAAGARPLLGEGPPARRPRPAPAPIDAHHRPDAWAAADRLWRGSGAPEPVSFRAAGAFAGAVTADAVRCTLCDACSKACPSGALALRREVGTVALAFDAGRCAGGCGLCARACPYEALEVADEVRLPAPERVLVAARREACPACGGEWTGAPAVPALEHRYDAGRDNEALRSFLTECPSCRRRRLTASLKRSMSGGPLREELR